MRVGKILLFLVSSTIHEGGDIQALMVIVHHLGSEIKAQEMQATMTYGFSTESLILKSFRIRGPIGTGDGMYNGGMIPTKRVRILLSGRKPSVLAFSLEADFRLSGGEKMPRIVGKIVLLIGLLATVGVAGWAFSHALFDFTQKGAGVGLGRVFFFFLYLPTALCVLIGGVLLAFRDRVTENGVVKTGALVVSLLLLLVAAGFTMENVMNNIRYYGGEGALGVLIQNLFFDLPLLLLSGLLFYLSRLGRAK